MLKVKCIYFRSLHPKEGEKKKKRTRKRKQTGPHESSEVNRKEVRVYRYFNAV